MSPQTFDLVSADDAVLVKNNRTYSTMVHSARIAALRPGRDMADVEEEIHRRALEEEIHRRAWARAARFDYAMPVELLSR
jgi:hypothetical protein